MKLTETQTNILGVLICILAFFTAFLYIPLLFILSYQNLIADKFTGAFSDGAGFIFMLFIAMYYIVVLGIIGAILDD